MSCSLSVSACVVFIHPLSSSLILFLVEYPSMAFTYLQHCQHLHLILSFLLPLQAVIPYVVLHVAYLILWSLYSLFSYFQCLCPAFDSCSNDCFVSQEVFSLAFLMFHNLLRMEHIISDSRDWAWLPSHYIRVSLVKLWVRLKAYCCYDVTQCVMGFGSPQCHPAPGGGWSPESSSFPTSAPLSGSGLPLALCLREGPSLAGDKIQSVTGSSTYFTSCKRVPLLRLQACWLSCTLSTLMGSRKIMNLMPVWAFSLLSLE